MEEKVLRLLLLHTVSKRCLIWHNMISDGKLKAPRDGKLKINKANCTLPVGCELTLAGDSLAVDDATICVWLDATVLDWDCDRDELFAVWWGGVDCCDCECNCDCVSGNCCGCCETSWLICWWWCNKGGLCDRSGVPDPVWISSYTIMTLKISHKSVKNICFYWNSSVQKKIKLSQIKSFWNNSFNRITNFFWNWIIFKLNLNFESLLDIFLHFFSKTLIFHNSFFFSFFSNFRNIF